MKEHPILMKPDLAQKAHDGLKTQTRRIIKPQPAWEVSGNPEIKKITNSNHWGLYINEGRYKGWCSTPTWKCPYAIGDRLWVREAWCPVVDPFVGGAATGIGYMSGEWIGGGGEGKFKNGWTCFNWEKPEAWKFRPSIYMPRWACRTVVEITDIRAQRLQDISNHDAYCEGVDKPVQELLGHGETSEDWITPFASLWDSINAQRGYPWDDNPWVWAYTFRRIGND